jgi:hypothetical protein
MQQALRVFIVAENEAEGRILRRTFEEAPGFVVVGVTTTSSSEAPQSASCDVVIVQSRQVLRPTPFRGAQVPILYLLSDERSQPKGWTGRNAALWRNASAPQIRAAAMQLQPDCKSREQVVQR